MKINIYYYGEDNSHCSSCRQSSDEIICIIMTQYPYEKAKKLYEKIRTRNVKDFIVKLEEELVQIGEKYFRWEIEGNEFLPEYETNCEYDTYDLKRFGK